MSQNPPAMPPLQAPVTVPPRRSDTLGVISLVLGIVSVPLSFVCVGILLAIPAVVTGAIAAISRRSKKGMIGAVCGVLGLAIFGGMMYLGSQNAKASTPAQTRLNEAERHVISSTDGEWSGNTASAKSMAAKLSAQLKQADSEMFEWKDGKKPKLSLSNEKFITHCFVTDTSCAFVVHVPGYRKYEDDAKTALAEIAWMIARSVGEESGLKPDTRLAVGLRGSLLYGAVMTGTVADAEAATQTTSGDDLLPYFKLPEDDAKRSP